MMTDTTINNIARAVNILDCWTTQPGVNTEADPDYMRLRHLWGSILDERHDNFRAAERYAFGKVGRVFHFNDLVQGPELAQATLQNTEYAQATLQNTEYARLEANARERRILAIATLVI